MNNAEFWTSIKTIISNGFTPEGLLILDHYAEQFISRELIFKRFSPREQYGCTQGGTNNVIASLLAGAENCPNTSEQGEIDFKTELEYAKRQATQIRAWSKARGIWIDNVDKYLKKLLGGRIAEGGEATVYENGSLLIKSIGLDYFIQPLYALDRISLHNTYFPETKMQVLGFGEDSQGEFKIIVEQPFIQGRSPNDKEIEHFVTSMGFTLINQNNWTYATPEIYLSDVHDENVICSESGIMYVIDCDIRLNTPNLHCGGIRVSTNEIAFNA